MTILQIIPGSGGSFYCGNCLRDSKYIEAFRALGHEVVKIPMYLPLFSDEHDITDIPVFYGAVSIYLKQMFPLLRKAPAWFDRLLNSGPLLKVAAGFAGSTRARGLEEMTVSMLLGEEGQQKEELDRMVDWIAEHLKPDIIHISNALLLGLAKRLKEKTRVPIFCSLQDEDTWVDVMKESSREMVWKLMETKAAEVDAFIVVSDYYRDMMQRLINIPEEKLHRVYIGVNPDDYEFTPSSQKERVIGFISRESYENGLDILVDAFIELRSRKGFDDVTLLITGGSTADDKKLKREIRRKVKKAGLSDAVGYHRDFEEDGTREFFRKVSVLSVPVRQGEAFGIYLLESMASGVPVVQPALGAFPEIVRGSGGGMLYEPNLPANLADSLGTLLSDPNLLEKLSRDAREGVVTSFNIQSHASEMARIYEAQIEKLKN